MNDICFVSFKYCDKNQQFTTDMISLKHYMFDVLAFRTIIFFFLIASRPVIAFFKFEKSDSCTSLFYKFIFVAFKMINPTNNTRTAGLLYLVWRSTRVPLSRHLYDVTHCYFFMFILIYFVLLLLLTQHICCQTALILRFVWLLKITKL